jgi:hypothetical protein
MKKAMRPMWAGLSSGMRKHNPAAKSVQAMLGNVARRRFRRPKVSMVKMAGKANRKFCKTKAGASARV